MRLQCGEEVVASAATGGLMREPADRPLIAVKSSALRRDRVAPVRGGARCLVPLCGGSVGTAWRDVDQGQVRHGSAATTERLC